MALEKRRRSELNRVKYKLGLILNDPPPPPRGNGILDLYLGLISVVVVVEHFYRGPLDTRRLELGHHH